MRHFRDLLAHHLHHLWGDDGLNFKSELFAERSPVQPAKDDDEPAEKADNVAEILEKRLHGFTPMLCNRDEFRD